MPSGASTRRGSSTPPGHSRDFWASSAGEEDGFGPLGEVEAVGAFGEAETRGVEADAHFAGVVFSAVENDHLAGADDGGGIEGVERFPLDGLVEDGVEEGGRGDGADDGLGVRWAGEGGGRCGLRRHGGAPLSV